MFNPEADIIARIESLELEARDIRRRVERAPTLDDRNVLNQQLGELMTQIALLKERITPRPPRLVPAK
jgi:hypothetical protein